MQQVVIKHSNPFFFVLFAFSSEFTAICRNFHYVFTTVRIWLPANSASTNEDHYAVLSALSSDSTRLTLVCNISRHCRSDAQCTVYSVSADSIAPSTGHVLVCSDRRFGPSGPTETHCFL